MNSLLPQPQWLSSFYLSAFLDTLQMQGYTVFVIGGSLPPIVSDPSALENLNWKRQQRKGAQRPSTVGEDAQLAAALAASLEQNYAELDYPELDHPEPDDPELEAALRLSRESQSALSPSVSATPSSAFTLPDEPPKGPDVTQLIFRLPDGSRVERRFAKDTELYQVFDFLNLSGFSPSRYKLFSTFPHTEFPDLSVTLAGAQLHPHATLVVQLR